MRRNRPNLAVRGCRYPTLDSLLVPPADSALFAAIYIITFWMGLR